MRKYKLFKCNKTTKLWRIKALIDIPLAGVTKGDVGGYVQSRDNLSDKHSCWVHKGATAKDKSCIIHNAQIMPGVIIKDNALISGGAFICGELVLGGFVEVRGNTKLFGRGEISQSKVIRPR